MNIPSIDNIFDAQTFQAALVNAPSPLPVFRTTLRNARRNLKRNFLKGTLATTLVFQHAKFIDFILKHAWQLEELDKHPGTSLIAVGGYGRQELHPYSDIDLLILLAPESRREVRHALEKFIVFLWDIGLEVGHSVRTLSECSHAASHDITIMTNLVEARLITGDRVLFNKLQEATNTKQMWPSDEFLHAKQAEQHKRYAKFDNTAYNLEPNIKGGPGGLRDMQVITWVAKRHFGVRTLHDLVTHQFLTETEYQDLIAEQDFLWQIRFALHLLNKRREDRLLFDYQVALAKQFGYQDQNYNLAVEQFMQRYYRTVKALNELNDVLSQLLQEAILYPTKAESITPLDSHFQIRNDYIEVTRPNVFETYPAAILEIFLLMGQHDNIKGISAGTLRLIREYRYLIDKQFRDNGAHNKLFISILRDTKNLPQILQLMSRYRILGKYIPEFGRIVGKMQYDLFHAYTVDQHTLFLIRNLCQFSSANAAQNFPICHHIMMTKTQPEILFIAALFHDIGKGRGGNHSQLGAQDAERFCLQHDLSDEDTNLISWLVENHLLMSSTAQRMDIHDPEIINEFTSQVQSQTRLDYLYALTVADICATNQKLWNDWKNSLLKELYHSTKRAIPRYQDNPLNRVEIISEVKVASLNLLKERGHSEAHVSLLWENWNDEYFLRGSTEEVAWQTQAVLEHLKLFFDDEVESPPLVTIRKRSHHGGSEIFIYGISYGNPFVNCSLTLDKLNLNIVDAKIINTKDNFILISFTVFNQDNEAISDDKQVELIRTNLAKNILLSSDSIIPAQRRTPRQLRHFSIPTEVKFSQLQKPRVTVIEVIAADRPGLLARIGCALAKCHVYVHKAKIATYGEKVEDLFYITDENQQPITDKKQQNSLRETICEMTQITL